VKDARMPSCPNATTVLSDSRPRLTLCLLQAWNVFDFICTMSPWVRVMLPNAGNLTVLRAVRVLRALRMVNRVPSLKKIIATLFESLPALMTVGILFAGEPLDAATA
jgi:hypothetical protein